MVMAESERESRPESSNTASSNRLQWLRQRREQLQEKLLDKNNELKNLCIEEAELTGILPPEIPLDPGENPPAFRRRVGTSFAYPQNIINKIKSSQAQEESTLELERHIQLGLAEVAFNILNDPSESKAVRRKHRLLYQQSQRRLKELDTRLNFIRQGYGRIQRRSSNVLENVPRQSSSYDDESGAILLQISGKNRMKKPRPPLDSTSNVERLPNDKINCDNLSLKLNSGVDQSSNDWYTNQKENSWMSNELATTPTSTNSTSNGIQNDNSDLYILSDQRRPRTYSHGNNEDVSLRNLRQSQMIERSYRTVPRGYNPDEEDETTRNWPKEARRQFDVYANQQSPPPPPPSMPQQLQQQQQHHPAKSVHKQPHKYHHRVYTQKQVPNVISDAQSIPLPYNPELFDQLSPNTIQSRSRHTYYPPGQYSHLSRNDDKKELQLLAENKATYPDRISRRTSHENIIMYRHEINQNDNWMGNVDSESGWTYPEDFQQPPDRFGSIDRRKQSNNIHRYRDANQDSVSAIITPATPPPPRYLKQSNSIKECKTNQQHQNTRYEQLDSPPSTRILLRTQSLGSVETWHSGGKSTPGSPTTAPPPSNINISNQQSPMSPVYHRPYNVDKNNSRDTQVSYRENEKDWYKISMDFAYNKSIPQKNLEIPAESNKSSNNNNNRRERDIDYEATNLAQNDKLTADGHTIIHAGKYQPYKEVTKPFEMSDFYKYSTKFRKKVDQSTSQGTLSSSSVPSATTTTTTTTSESNLNSTDKIKCNNDLEINDTTDIRQKTTKVPVAQRTAINSGQIKLASQSYIAVRVDDNNTRDWSNNSKCQPTTKDSTVV